MAAPLRPLMENRTARITLLIDPKKKQLFEEICAEQDLTSSQVVRRLIHQYIIEHAGSRDLPEWLSGPAARSGKTPQ
ncbi:MAG: CopG family transcriptional regulator [Thiobacillus sp.]|nr:CopG family transcriptional regulator [Thiobacillus sp.]MDP2980165.1 CopG family transcriptional regulator [Thiobacillus sp.]